MTCATCNRLHAITLVVVDVVFGKEFERRVCSPCRRAELKEMRRCEE